MPAGPSLAVLAPRGAFPRATRGTRRRASSSMTPRALARPTPGASIPSDAPVSRAMRDLAPRDHVPGNHLFQTAAKTAVAAPPPAPKPLTISGVPAATFAAGAGVALLAALGSGVGFMRTPTGKSLAEEYAEKLNFVQRRAAMKLEAEAIDAFGGAGAKFPIIHRYAERVLAQYDSAAIPDVLEVFVYETIIKTAALGAFLSAYVNVKGSDVLGHPVRLQNEIEWGHEPPPPEVKEEDVYAFVSEVLDDDDESVGLIPKNVELELYRNAFITGIYIMEDTLKSVKIRLFAQQYAFNISPAKRGWKCEQVHPLLTDDQLRRLMREEIKAPAATRLLPNVEKNVARVAVALAGEVVGSTEFVFLGLPLRVSLQPPGEKDVPSMEEAATTANGERASAGAKPGTSPATLELIENYVDAYLESRPKRSFISNPLFFSRKLERETYAGFLSQVLGTVENAVVANVFGFDVVLNVGMPQRDAEGKLKMPKIDFARQSKRNHAAIEEFVDWLMADPVYNIKAVPDVIERQIYINVFELLTSLLAGGLSTFELELMGRNITMRASEVPEEEMPNLAEMKPFAPNAEVLKRFASDTTDIEAVQEVMCNVYAFVLAFAAYELSGVEATLVGRKLRLELDQPTDAAEELALDAAMDSEFNNNLRRALTVLVQEMVEVATGAAAEEVKRETNDSDSSEEAEEKEAERTEGLSRVREFVNVGLARFGLGRSSEDGKGGEAKLAEEETDELDRFLDALRPGIASGLDRLGLTEKFEASSLTNRLTNLIPKPRRSGAGEPKRAKKETDNAIYSTFITHHTPANSMFPFPYLTPEDFDAALTDLVLRIRPGRAVPTSAVKMVASAADSNGDGVIQWAEYYFAAKELKAIFEEMDAKRAARRKQAEEGDSSAREKSAAR